MRSALFLALNLGAPAVPSIGFEWDAPAECPSADDVEARVAARVGAPLREGDGARLDVIARVRRDDAGEFAMRVWIIDEQRTHRRDVKDADCGLLADAAATVVAVFVAPKTVPEAPPAPEPEAPKSEATPSQMSWARTSRSPLAPAPTPVERHRGPALGGDVRVLGHVELGTLRGAGGGVGIAGSLDVARARIELRARSTFAPATALRGGEVTLRLWSAGARGGFVPRWGRLELALMGGVEFGVLTAHARGLPQARGGRVAWSSLVVGPGLVFRPHPRIGLWLDIDGFVTLLRPRIGLDDDSLVHQPAPGGFRASAGVGVRFGRSGTVTDRSRRRQPIPEDPAR